ncbi:hypothetical protein CVT26_008461 [Gymnopilus dilepis]|uniref:tRNA(His) guanylyltransferase n=1 Tax=Gymnopilus dilepis TaxID=231916 RepID=A0A409XXE7_9AGAR|nr:hypothetical protein CVT26_008461 [Gymnopilus dilepis]
MANSKYAYVRDFELPDPLLPGTFMLFRLDGHSFHRFSDVHEFKKPNDIRALQLMDHAAKDVMNEYPDIVLAFGESDEFSFLLRKSTSLYNRRQSKIVSTLTSLFTSSYVFHWQEYFPGYPLQYPPSFDGRIVLYPTGKQIRDYFAWRQADTHINNLYNTTFWALVQDGGQSTTEAHATLRGTFSKDKNEILYSRFGINYNRIDARFRKGSVLFRTEIPSEEAVGVDDGRPSVITTSLRAAAAAISGEERTSSGRMANESTESTSDIIAKSAEKEPSSTQEHSTLPSETSTAIPGIAQGQDVVHLETALPVASTTDIVTPAPPEPPKPKPKPKDSVKKSKQKQKQIPTKIEIVHCDIIQDDFWNERPWILDENWAG